jgi:hypothetical protein
MGNHEYCVDCGENDFHHGSPCNPESYRKHQEYKQQIEERDKKIGALADKLMEILRGHGLDAYLDRYDNVVISKWSLENYDFNLIV